MTITHTERNKSHKGLRPTRIEFDLASGFTPPDQSGGLDYTAVGTKLALRQLKKYCDDDDSLVVSGGSILLPAGTWRVVFHARGTKTGAGAEQLEVAITFSGGTVVAMQSEPVKSPAANPSVVWARAEAVLTVVNQAAAAARTIDFRAAQTTGGTDYTIDPAIVGYAERVANLEQDLGT